MYRSTTSTSHVAAYFGAGGRLLNTPLRNRETRGCCPIRVPSISSWVIDIADRIEFIVRYCFPRSNWSDKNSRISFKGAEKGSMSRSIHQLAHNLQADEYAASVDCLQELLMMPITRSESPCVEHDRLI